MEGEAQRPRNSSASSPEFEFWMVRNPSSTPPELLTADELIVDGVLLPLHLLSLHHSYPSTQTLPDTSPPPPPLPPADPPPDSILAPTSSAAPAGVRIPAVDGHIQRAAGDKKPEEKEKERRDRRRNASGFASGDLNFNLNIWPFPGATQPEPQRKRRRTRKVSSAPCSRSNSRGESSIGGCAGRRWTSSPARGGVHLGRSSPVWKLRRTGMGTKDMSRNSNAAACSAHGGGGVRLINLNVNSCIGYQNQVTCRDDDSDGVAAGGSRTAEGGRSNAGSIFRLRALFSKKVY
ncbi:hypothetical protein KSP39_PZI017183 [Platanthera zijinensis]|uniref:Uncharacterized protein n=1 Tax=Platanthera zijinensis TaxID=2320716 RepID=A0AAP0FZM9_9ASPA